MHFLKLATVRILIHTVHPALGHTFINTKLYWLSLTFTTAQHPESFDLCNTTRNQEMGRVGGKEGKRERERQTISNK